MAYAKHTGAPFWIGNGISMQILNLVWKAVELSNWIDKRWKRGGAEMDEERER